MREGVTMRSLEYWQICEQRMRELARGSDVTARVSARTALPVAGRRRGGR